MIYILKKIKIILFKKNQKIKLDLNYVDVVTC